MLSLSGLVRESMVRHVLEVEWYHCLDDIVVFRVKSTACSERDIVALA